MSSSKNDAMKKFWQLPELVEKLLPLLSVKSVLNLVKAHSPTIKILKNRSNKIWRGLVHKIIWPVHNPDEPLDELEREIQYLNELLQMMGGPESLLLELLDAICRRYASHHKYRGVMYEGEVVVNCPCH